jgi:hypothetical protein
MPRWPGFVGPSYRSQSAIADAERLVNWYVAKLQSQAAKAPFVLYPTPGHEEFLTLPQAPLRDLFGQQGRAWAVAGDRIHEVFGDMTAIDRGVVRFDGNPATSITNGDGGGQMLFTSGNHAYLLDMTTNALTDVVTGALMCGMLDTFFLVLDAGTSTLKISESNDGLTWLGTQIFQRSSASDPWRALKVVNKRIYMFGEFTTDVFFNAGTSPFPFAPYGGSLIPHGIAAAFSAAEFQGGVAFLAQNRNGDRTVRLATGYSSADEISNEAVNYQLSRYDRVDDAEGFSYEEQGEPFYILNFPSANASWGYTEDGGWHERGTWNPAANRYDVWHPRCHAFAFGEHLVGDRTSGRIDRMSIDLGLDAGGVALRRLRRAPAINQEHQRLYISNLELYLDAGVADATGQGSDPQVMLRKSRNGGRTWGPELWRRTGKPGEYGRRVRWNRLGSGRDIAVEVVVSDPWPRSIVDCFINQAA